MRNIAVEIDRVGRRGARPLESLYCGGGTPSLLGSKILERFFVPIERHFPRLPGAEVTIEANPEDVDETRIATWGSLGVNRVSIGVQPLDDRVLGVLDRRHSARRAVAAVELV